MGGRRVSLSPWQFPAEWTAELQQRLGDILELFVKLAGALGIVWAFMAKVAKPYREWRHRQLTVAIRAALEPELKVVERLADTEEAVNDKLKLMLDRQGQAFDEFDLFVEVIGDYRERLDEYAELMDAVFASRDRRENTERRRMADEAMATLQGRMRARRRRDDDIRELEERT